MAVPDLRLGGSNAPTPEQFSSITLVAVSESGQIAVMDGAERHLHLYSSGGAHLKVLGRPGTGPAEFQVVSAIGFFGDTIYAIDFGNRLIMMLNTEGHELRRTPYSPANPRVSLGYLPAFPAVVLPNSSTIGKATAVASLVRSGQLSREPVIRMTLSGSVLDTVLWVRAPVRRKPTKAVPLPVAQPFFDGDIVAFAPRLGLSVVVQRSVPARATASRFAVTVVSPEGDTIFSRSLEYLPQRLTPTIIDEALQPLFNAGRSMGFSSADIRAAVVLPEFVPPVTKAIAGADGSVWLRRTLASSDHSVWWVLDRRGRLEGQVTLPARVEILYATRRSLWARTDERNSPTLVRYSIR